jgi:hypothetical protein
MKEGIMVVITKERLLRGYRGEGCCGGLLLTELPPWVHLWVQVITFHVTTDRATLPTHVTYLSNFLTGNNINTHFLYIFSLAF